MMKYPTDQTDSGFHSRPGATISGEAAGYFTVKTADPAANIWWPRPLLADICGKPTSRSVT